MLPDDLARPTLGEPLAVHQHQDRLAPPGRAHQLPDATSFSASISSSLSATIRFRRVFSRSSSFSRLTSSPCIPPYCAGQRWNVFSETSSALATSGIVL